MSTEEKENSTLENETQVENEDEEGPTVRKNFSIVSFYYFSLLLYFSLFCIYSFYYFYNFILGG